MVQVDPMKPQLKLLGSKRLKLKCDVLLSNGAFKFNLRRYTLDAATEGLKGARLPGTDSDRHKASVTELEAKHQARRCRLTVSKPVLKLESA